uniref:Cell cycle progression 1 n=1 Tax=Loxodonta africana TaxID=9785 RepID=G3UC47_LOXAF
MSENSSDSDSSCGWTVINHEGSDIEMVNSERGVASDSRELTPECSSLEQEELQVLQLEQGGKENSQNCTMLTGETTYSAVEETKSAVEAEEEKSPEDNVYFGTVSDDSDIVTLEPPKLEEIGTQEEAIIVEETQSPEDFNMGSSSSSQYTFCQPEIGKNCIEHSRTSRATYYRMACFLTLNLKTLDIFWCSTDNNDKICYS